MPLIRNDLRQGGKRLFMNDNRHAADGVSRVRAGGFCHAALLVRSQEHYLAEVTGFVHAALARDEPVLVAVPAFRAGPLRRALGAGAQRAVFTDMTEVGRNPARIIPAVTEFAMGHAGKRVSCVGECTWPGRTDPELNEAVDHEALANLAFHGMPVTALCPFDMTGLPPRVLGMAEQTHPLLASRGTLCPSTAYTGTAGIPQPCLQPLPEPPAQAEVLLYQWDLRPPTGADPPPRQPVRLGRRPRRRPDPCGQRTGHQHHATHSHRRHAANLAGTHRTGLPGHRPGMDQGPARRAAARGQPPRPPGTVGRQPGMRPGRTAHQPIWDHHPAAHEPRLAATGRTAHTSQ